MPKSDFNKMKEFSREMGILIFWPLGNNTISRGMN